MEGREMGELRKSDSQLWRGREQIRGEKGEKEERWGKERAMEVPGRIFFQFFFLFSFGWLRFNHFHPMDEKKWRHGTSGGIVELRYCRILLIIMNFFI